MNILAAKSGEVPEINHRRVTKYKIATKCSSVIQYTVYSTHTVDTIDTGDCNDHINWGQSATVELFCHTGRRAGGMAPMTNAGYLLPCRGQGIYILRSVVGVSYHIIMASLPATVQTSSLDHTGVAHRGQCRFVWLIAVWDPGLAGGGGGEGSRTTK